MLTNRDIHGAKKVFPQAIAQQVCRILQRIVFPILVAFMSLAFNVAKAETEAIKPVAPPSLTTTEVPSTPQPPQTHTRSKKT